MKGGSTTLKRNQIHRDNAQPGVPKAIIRLVSLFICAGVYLCAYILFLDHAVSAAAAVLLFVPVLRKVKKEMKTGYEKRLRREFATCLMIISGGLSAGQRLEQCISEIAAGGSKEISRIRPEFVRMSRLLQLNWSAGRAFDEMASRVPLREIAIFTQALNVGIPGGVNLVEFVRTFSSGLRMRNDVEAEISRTLNLPKYNNRIVMIMPFFMMAVIRITAGDYISPMDSGTGFVIKIIASLVIFAAFVLGELLGNIDYAA